MRRASHSLPTGWIETSLGSVIDYGTCKKAEPSDIADTTWVLELEDIEKDSSKLLTRVTYGDRRSKSTKNCFEAGDVLYGKLRPYLNKVLIADKAGTCTTEIVPLRPNDAVNGTYLFYWMKSPTFLNYVSAVSHGVNMPRLGTEAGRSAPFLLAPLAEQKRIADKLDSVLARVDACRERLNRVHQIVKHFRRSILAAAVSGHLSSDWREKSNSKVGSGSIASHLNTDERVKDAAHVMFELPCGWSWGALATGILEASYGTSSKSSRAGTMPVLRMGNLQRGKIDWNGLVFSNNELDNVKYVLSAGDVLFNRTNSPELVGKTSIYLGERPAIYAGYLIRVRCNEAVLLPKYLNFCLNSPYGRAYCWAVKSDGVSQSNINAEKLRNFPVPYCELDEQREIIRRVDILFAFADRLEARLATLRTTVDRLTPALLAKSFRGELVPQDPDDEPAAELLKRLAVARESAQKTRRRSKSANTTED